MWRHPTGASTLALVLLVVLPPTLVGCGSRAGAPPVTAVAAPSSAPSSSTYVHVPYLPTPRDLTLTVVTLERQCFGDVACNVTARVELTYRGRTLYPGEGPYEVRFRLTGTRDAVENRLTLRGDLSYTWEELFFETAPGAVLGAEVTAVEPL